MTNAFDGLLHESTGRTVDPKTLTLLAKEASQEYVQNKVPLHDTIIKMASQHPEWTNEHVKRLAEQANQETHAALFAKEASPVKNIVFDYADPAVILGELKKTAKPEALVKASSAYSQQLPDFRDDLVSDQMGNEMLASAFGVPAGQEKVAETPEPSVQDWHTMRGGLDHIRGEANGVEVMYDQASELFDDAVKQAMLEGATLDEVGIVIEKVVGTDKLAHVKEALGGAVEKALKEEWVPHIEEPSAEKLAELRNRAVDPSSPLAKAAHYLAQVSERRTLLKEAEAVASEEFASLDKQVRSAAGGLG